VSEEHNNQNDIPDDEATQPLDTSGDIGSEETGSGNEELGVEQLQQELAESRDQVLRLAAEFENFKKRIERRISRNELNGNVNH
jgi:molecular chaperone GrpE